MKIAIIGAGRQGVRLMELLHQHEFYEIHPQVIAVSDKDPDAPGMKMARGQDIFTTTDYRDLFKRSDIDLIVELTNSHDVFMDILDLKPPRVRAISSNVVKIFWELSRVSAKEKKTRQELQEASAMYKNTRKTLMQQEKLASIGRLSAGVAHEINNPMTTILTSAMLMQEDLTQDDPLRKELDLIASETMRCRKIVTSLLNFSRQSQPDKRLHDLNLLIAECELLTHKQAAFKDIDMETELDEQLPAMYYDKGQIEQALINLILNAVEATDQGGRITIAVNCCRVKNFADITISDTGEGIPKGHLDKIFDPFFTTKEAGTGLGLAITHGIIEQHGGRIEVHSREGQGTRFTIMLPIHQEEEVHGLGDT